jgi:hypothetical protein
MELAVVKADGHTTSYTLLVQLSSHYQGRLMLAGLDKSPGTKHNAKDNGHGAL